MKSDVKGILAILLGLAILMMVSCKKETIEDDPMSETPEQTTGTDGFSDEDLAVLQNTLNLTATPFNYANLPLPQHFTDGEVDPLDNMPDDNRTTDMGATLGRVLFYDKKLSANNTISCSSCHQQANGFADSKALSMGIDGQQTRRNAMGLINARYYQSGRFGWDERAESLEDMVLLPIQDHVEMAMPLNELEGKLQQVDYYPVLFRNAFGTEQVTTDRIAKALAQYVRSIVSYQTKFDEGMALTGFPFVAEGMPIFPNYTDQEKMGQEIYFSGTDDQANCLYCHGSPAMVVPEQDIVTPDIDDSPARNNGLQLNYTDKGKGAITGVPTDQGKFKVPSLRNIALTAPYMHDGRFQTLEQVIDHYSDGVVQHRNLHFRLSTVDDGPLGSPPKKHGFSQEEKDALIAFLNTLTDEKITSDPKYSDPFK